MIQLCKLLLCAVIALLFNSAIYAQNFPDSVYIYLPAQTSGSEGQIINIPVKVRQFKDLTVAQFAIQWDSTVARYVGVNGFGISGMTYASHFGNTTADMIRFAWYDNNLAPKSIADNNLVFNLQLKLVGKKGQNCPISFTSDNLTAFEFNDKNSKEIKFGLANGSISINAPIAVQKTPSNKIKIAPPTPNPFQEESLIKLDIAENQVITLEIFDLTGKKIHQEKTEYEVGTHFVNINKNNNIKNAGVYLYRITTSKGERVAGKVIKI